MERVSRKIVSSRIGLRGFNCGPVTVVGGEIRIRVFFGGSCVRIKPAQEPYQTRLTSGSRRGT